MVGRAAWEPIITADEGYQDPNPGSQGGPQDLRSPLSSPLPAHRPSPLLEVQRDAVGRGPKRRATLRVQFWTRPRWLRRDHRGPTSQSKQLIADAVLYRLDTPELADALAGKGPSAMSDKATTSPSSWQNRPGPSSTSWPRQLRQWHRDLDAGMAGRSQAHRGTHHRFTERKLRQAMNTKRR